MEEYVGRRVKKELHGRGTFFGSVQEYEPDTGLFKIVYDNGDSEELELKEVASIAVKGKADDNSVINCGVSGKLLDGSGDSVELEMNGGLDLNDEGFNHLNGGDHAKLPGLDLNAGLNLEMDVGLDLNGEVNKGMIDLNVDVNEDFESLCGEKKGQSFDLNLEVTDDDVNNLHDCEVQCGASTMVCDEEYAQIGEKMDLDDCKEILVDVNGDMENTDLNMENKEDIPLQKCSAGTDGENESPVTAPRKKRGRKRKDCLDSRIEMATPDIAKLKVENGNSELQLDNVEETPLRNSPDPVVHDNGTPGTALRGRRGRKRKEPSDNTITLPTPETGLRRSSRRAKQASLSSQDFVSDGVAVDGTIDQLSSPAVSVMYDEMVMDPCPENSEENALPQKVELPSSSANLDLNGVSVFDFVSIYAFLRSFSTLLFLSPFELDDFVAAVKCNDSTSLFDSIHVSLLRILRKHLESLAKEGSPSAPSCLRSLNWDFLDLITWPMFVVEYLLLHSSGQIPSLDLCRLKPFLSDYYKLPISTKVEILRHLCDDAIESDAVRLEINKRTLTADQLTGLDRNTKSDRKRSRKAAIDVGTSSSSLTEEDNIDGNSDECSLCKMDGNLICCDGCPAAFHSRCVGVVSSLLPEGDWFCPDCVIEKGKPWKKVGKSIRGSELLGIDPHGRVYYSSCGYLLVLESCDDNYSFWLYNRNDLPPLIEALESSRFLYDAIINAITKHWNLVHGFVQGTDSVSTTNGINYVNYYEFARTASSFYEEFTTKSSNKVSEAATKSAEEIIGVQVKIVSDRFSEFSWSNAQNSNSKSRKENCGWCYYCRVPEAEKECLFIMNDNIPASENFTGESLGMVRGKNRKNHLMDLICHIICIEDHLHGLLVGPWIKSNYSAIWRDNVLGVADVNSLKNLLLKLEANLNRLALSSDWEKHVDSISKMGSSCHFVSSSSRVSSKVGIVRKKAGLNLLWWRGGRSSRELFNWKVLPRSLAAKAARQGGCKKIPGVLYPDGGDAKRTKYAAWRAAVEAAKTVEQLALQVRELEANIRWDDICKTNLLSKMDMDSKKPVKSFKKVIIRKKCSEGAVVRYLLDFGKRRFIPDIVIKHGSKVEDSSSEKKKYWLEESHVPLHLLKGFEEKRIARKTNKISPGKLREKGKVMKKPIKEKGFAYLFAKAEKLENYECSHCKKDVHISEAVSCQYCKGFFHKKHVRRSTRSVTPECTYTCHNCQNGELVKFDEKKGKIAAKKLKPLPFRKGKKQGKNKQPVMKSKKNTKKVPLVITLRRSARNAERNSKLSLPNTKSKKRKKKKQGKSKKGKLKKPKTGVWQKKRTPVSSSYWLDGLRFSRRENDKRGITFRSKMLLVLSGEVTLTSGKPHCSLCRELEYASKLNYVACEICGAWFHGDALNLTADKILNLIGFKCHNCLQKKLPICPHSSPTGNNKDEIIAEHIQETESIGVDLPLPAEKSSPDQIAQPNDDSNDICLTDINGKSENATVAEPTENRALSDLSGLSPQTMSGVR